MTMTRRTFLKIAGAAALTSSLPGAVYAAARNNSLHRIPALLYHDISAAFRDDYTLSPALFSAQMEWLYANGYQAPGVADLPGFLAKGRGRAVVITFDDGYISFMDYAAPLLDQYGFKALINIIGSAVDTHAVIDGRPILSWDECRYLLSQGTVEFGCHCYTLHKRGGVLSTSYAAIEKDLARFQERYATELGKRCTVLSWPYGIYDKTCMEIAQQTGFEQIFTSNEGYIDERSSMNELPRLNINHKLDLVSFQQYIGAAP